MSLLNQIIYPSQAYRPVHVTLSDPHPSLKSLLHTLEDPFYKDKHRPHSHHNDSVSSPNFDVRESEAAFYLEGEFPGVGGKEDIVIEKLGPRTLLMETRVERWDEKGEWGEREQEGDDEGRGKEGEGLRVRLAERHVGYLQRSFTFPSAVDIDNLKARLRHGLLVMRVPKIEGRREDSKRISIED